MPPSARKTPFFVLPEQHEQPAPCFIAYFSDLPESFGACRLSSFTAFVALRGDRALSIAQQVTPDLILLDALMPGMDGFETCRALKRDPALARVPVIFMTGLSETEDVVRGFEAGGVDYITKPIEPQELLARLRVHLANARIERSTRAALDNAGRYLMAADEKGALLWWTPLAGVLLAEATGEAPVAGQALPAMIAELIAPGIDAARVRVERLAITSKTRTIDVQGVGWLSPGELLLRISESTSMLAQDTIADKLAEAYQISSRESEVLLWLAQGKTNRDIADILKLSPRTINKHLERIFRKIGVENRTAASNIVITMAQKEKPA